MRVLNPPRSVGQVLWYAGVVLFAVTFGAVLLACIEMLQPKWIMMVVAALGVLGMAVASGHFERFLFALLILAIPVNPDINLHQGGMPIAAQMYAVSVTDLILWTLYALWLARLSHERGVGFSTIWPRGAGIIIALMGWGALSMATAYRADIGPPMLFALFRQFLVFFYLANKIRTREDLRLFITCLLVGVIIESFFAFAQHAAGSPLGLDVFGERRDPKEMELESSTIFRVGGTLGHPNALGGYLASILPVAFAVSLAKVEKWLRMLAIAATLLGMLALVLTFSRSAWLAVAVAFVAVFWWIASDRQRRRRLGPLLLVGAVLGVGMLGVVPMIKARLEANDKGSTESRWPQFQMALSMVKAHPWLGVGINNYSAVMPFYEVYTALEKGGRVFIFYARVHNILLLTMAEMGIMSIVLLAWFVGQAIWRGWRAAARAPDELVQFAMVGMVLGLCGRLFHDATHTGNLSNITFLWIYPAILASDSLWPRRDAVPAEPRA